MATYLKGFSLRELRDLYVLNARNMEDSIADTVAGMRETEARIAAALGREVSGCDVLEVGPGQRSPFRYFFASTNRYRGIDIEPLQQNGLFGGFIDDFRNRGATRAFKTFGRRALGVDRRYEAEMFRQLGLDRLEGEILCMDATQMQFEDNSVDVVVSTSVFEHLPEPGLVAAEIARVLRPGGVAHIITHFFTSDSGIHDTRIFVGDRADIPFWSHLRPDHRDKVQANSYLNELRLNQYREIFDAAWPGAGHQLFGQASEAQEQALAALREAGELADYQDEELLTNALCTVWTKPDPGRC